MPFHHFASLSEHGVKKCLFPNSGPTNCLVYIYQSIQGHSIRVFLLDTSMNTNSRRQLTMTFRQNPNSFGFLSNLSDFGQ